VNELNLLSKDIEAGKKPLLSIEKDEFLRKVPNTILSKTQTLGNIISFFMLFCLTHTHTHTHTVESKRRISTSFQSTSEGYARSPFLWKVVLVFQFVSRSDSKFVCCTQLNVLTKQCFFSPYDSDAQFCIFYCREGMPVTKPFLTEEMITKFNGLNKRKIYIPQLVEGDVIHVPFSKAEIEVLDSTPISRDNLDYICRSVLTLSHHHHHPITYTHTHRERESVCVCVYFLRV
jgi:hypothetical protein